MLAKKIATLSSNVWAIPSSNVWTITSRSFVTLTFSRIHFLLKLKVKGSQMSQFSSSQAEVRKKTLQEYCSVLEVEIHCTESELRSAYLKKVKDHHPDKQKDGTDATMFNEIYNAYQKLLDYKRDQAAYEETEARKEDDEEEEPLRHTAPQHRQYLTFEGVGYGTPAQRKRQYQQFKVTRANERVYEHRKMKLGDGESALVAKDKAQARKIRTSNLIHRLVDDMVRESMQRGDFDNLAGKGKPLDYSNHNPLVDTTTHNLNKIMVNNGFMPEWILMSKEIRTELNDTRQKLAVIREKLGPPPYSDLSTLHWDFHVDKFKCSVKEINQKINKFNFIVPFMEKQMVHYDVDLNLRKVLEDHKSYLPRDEDGQPILASQMPSFPQSQAEDAKIRWGEVWSNIKDVFKYR